MNYKIEYNRAVEFIGAIFKYSSNKSQQTYWNNKEFASDAAKGVLDFVPNADVKRWLKHVDDNISPFLRNDITFITNKVYGLPDICFHLVITQNLKEPMEIIEAIKNLDSRRIVEMNYKYYELDLPLDSGDIELRNALTEVYSKEIASCFMQIKNHPDEYKKHTIAALENFYNSFYKPFEENTYAYMEERLKSHSELFEKNPINFINTVGLGDYSKVINQYDEIKVYVSFYIDLGLFYFSIENLFVMFYGQTIEHRFDNKKAQDASKALFKALSDDKRIEIIKLTSKRPWYNKELADYFNLTTATLSYHLNLLLDLGILNFEPSINNRYYYSTNSENLERLFKIALQGLLD